MSNQRRRANARKELKQLEVKVNPSTKLNKQQKRTKNNPELQKLALEIRESHKKAKESRNERLSFERLLKQSTPIDEKTVEQVKELTLGVTFTDKDFE